LQIGSETMRTDDVIRTNDDSHPEVLTNETAHQRLTARFVEQACKVSGTMKILESGCGRRWHIDLRQTDYELTGIDLDAHALDHRRSVTRDLDVGIVGDIRDRDVVPLKHFDIVYSAYVLEHIDGAHAVLKNFAEWVRPGGLIILLVPNRNSVYGWAARHSPHRFHVWVYRHLFGNRDAGKPGFGPYPTCYDSVLTLSSLAAFCLAQELSLQEWFAIDTFSDRPGVRSAAMRMGMRIVSRLCRGRLSDREIDLCVVMCKPPA
jgi:SAM-dependent methyltransferase